MKEVEEALFPTDVRMTSVKPKNFKYAAQGMAHIELNIGAPRFGEDFDATTEVSDAEFDTHFTYEKRPKTPATSVQAQHRTKAMKILKDLPGVLSVESIAGITFSRETPEDERKAHSKATEHTYFKKRLGHKKDLKAQKQREAMHKHRQPHKHSSTQEEL